MAKIETRNSDGDWVPAKPHLMYGPVAKTEEWLRVRGFKRLANVLAWWDERGL